MTSQRRPSPAGRRCREAADEGTPHPALRATLSHGERGLADRRPHSAHGERGLADRRPSPTGRRCREAADEGTP